MIFRFLGIGIWDSENKLLSWGSNVKDFGTKKRLNFASYVRAFFTLSLSILGLHRYGNWGCNVRYVGPLNLCLFFPLCKSHQPLSIKPLINFYDTRFEFKEEPKAVYFCSFELFSYLELVLGPMNMLKINNKIKNAKTYK